MNYRINWAKINEGYKGFEKLAVRYVQCNYNEKFKKTSDTRDGNKDACLVQNEYTIVLGFQQAETSEEEWWMEAKFSTSNERLTRYRLDATLVSAILKGNVGRIIFVTNININAQTVNDIRQAITYATYCKEADFCTRDGLEYWLYQNPDIIKEFFPDYCGAPVELPNLMLIEQADFLSTEKSKLVFRESLNVLDINRIYIARFAVYANEPQEIQIKPTSYLKGIKILGQHKRKISIGVNWLEINFRLEPNFGYKSAKAMQEHSQLPAPAFQLGVLNIVSRRTITVSEKTWKAYRIPSQETLLQELSRFFAESKRSADTRLFYISGQSGVGKSYVLDAFTESISKSNTLLFTCEMSSNPKNCLDDLVRCIDFMYFPFLPPDSVNKEYLDRIKNVQFFSPLYYDVICSDHTAEALGNLLTRYLSEDIRLFPNRFYVNRRLIIIDNVHKANDLIINTIYKMVMELSEIKAPYTIILSGQQIRHTRYYTELSKAILISERELCITREDCLSLFPMEQISPEIRNLFQANLLFSNMMELLFFTEYILDSETEVKDFNSFAVLYHLFFQKRIMDLYIGRLFMDAVRDDDKADSLCNEIYWGSVGVEKADQPEGQKLLRYHVVKQDSATGQLIPYHDIYTNYYRKKYSNRGVLEIPFVELMDGTDSSAREAAIKKIHDAFKEKKFIFVYYSLEPIYRDSTSLVYQDVLDETEYYHLFYEYALSCTHCSLDYSGKKMFEHIYTETATLLNPSNQTRIICNKALWELTNSTFESLDYKQAATYAEELIKNTCGLITRHIIDSDLFGCVRYHNANVILSLIKSELQEEDSNSFFEHSAHNMMKYGFQNRCWSYCVRYGLTVMQSNPSKALRILSSCCDHYDMVGDFTEKYLMWAHFYFSYTKMIVYNDIGAEDEALQYMEQLHKFFFNDYRKASLGMAAYFYYRGDYKKGDNLLLSDCHVLRPRRPRLQGFFHLTNAIRELLNGDIQTTVEELGKASAIFRAIPSYYSLIQHNINLLKKSTINQETSECCIFRNLSYYLGGPLEKDVYYIDIRGCW